jgi:hypothetical protein
MPSSKESQIRVLYLMRSVSHFSYHQSTVRALLNRGAHVQIAIDPKWSKGRSCQFVESWIAATKMPPFEWAPLRREGWKRNLIFPLREVRTYASYLRRPEQSAFYLNRWQGYLPSPILRLLKKKQTGRAVRWILGRNWMDRLFQFIEACIPPDKEILRFIQRCAPDVVIGSPVNMRFSEEVEYFKAAKKLGIPTVLPVYSWDNLTTKGLIHVNPDLLLAWNEAHQNEAVQIHKQPKERIQISGSPFFDKWFEQNAASNDERSDYLKKVGLDPTRPFFTYLGSSKNIAGDETWVIDSIVASLATSQDPYLRSLQILVRPHPSNFDKYQRSFGSNVALWPRPPFDFELGVPETSNALRDFYLALTLCDATLGINTSAMLESVIADTPTGCFITDKYRKTQEQAVHFQQLWGSGALKGIRSDSEFLVWLQQLRTSVDSEKSSRQNFVRDFVRPKGLATSAGDFQAGCALELAQTSRKGLFQPAGSILKENAGVPT